MPSSAGTVRPGGFDLDRLRDGLKPAHLHWFPRLGSTSSQAALLRKRSELFAPALILTGHQLAGRGRGSHTWFSGNGSLTVTFALPIESHLAPHQLPLIAGLAVREAAAEIVGLPSGHDIALKWPNDLLYYDRKLAGLLCERVHHVDLIGLGLNVNLKTHAAPRSLQRRIVSLHQLSNRPLDMTDALLTIWKHLRAFLRKRDEVAFTTLLREYDQHHALRNRDIRVITDINEPPVIGRCQGLDRTGRLLVQTATGLKAIISGQVLL